MLLVNVYLCKICNGWVCTCMWQTASQKFKGVSWGVMLSISKSKKIPGTLSFTWWTSQFQIEKVKQFKLGKVHLGSMCGNSNLCVIFYIVLPAYLLPLREWLNISLMSRPFLSERFVCPKSLSLRSTCAATRAEQELDWHMPAVILDDDMFPSALRRSVGPNDRSFSLSFFLEELFFSFTFKSFNGSYPFGVHLFYLQKFQWSLLFWCWILGWIVISTHCHPTSLWRSNAWRDKIAFLC